jgi:hypothetical protein
LTRSLFASSSDAKDLGFHPGLENLRVAVFGALGWAPEPFRNTGVDGEPKRFDRVDETPESTRAGWSGTEVPSGTDWSEAGPSASGSLSRWVLSRLDAAVRKRVSTAAMSWFAADREPNAAWSVADIMFRINLSVWAVELWMLGSGHRDRYTASRFSWIGTLIPLVGTFGMIWKPSREASFNVCTVGAGTACDADDSGTVVLLRVPAARCWPTGR